MGFIEKALRRVLPHKEIGWKEIGETFTRFTLLKTPWFNLYLHRLDAPKPHELGHDHSWSFVTCILKGGYYEDSGDGWDWRGPLTVLYRPAEHCHNVYTKGICWSIVATTRKFREWSLKECE